MSKKVRKNLLDRLIKGLGKADASNIQAYILHLSREKGFLETVFETIQDGILVIDRKLKIRYFNRAARKILALPEDLSKVRISQFLPDINWKRVLQLEAEEWSKVSRQEIEILYPEQRVLQFYLVPHADSDAESGNMATIILRDVSKSREQTIKQLESEKVQAISMLAASVAHEIGNPLNSLYLHLQLMERQLKDGKFDPEEATKLLAVARGEVERLDNIIEQFLGAIRPGKLNLQKIDLKELIVEVLNFMREEIESRAVKVKCQWPDILPEINADAAQLKQAFYNILKNALQAMGDGGEIDIDCLANTDKVEIRFADSGSGIAQSDMAEIFEPFHSSKDGGTGLGMMIVERIVREHGAELTIESSEDDGTVVSICFHLRPRRMRLLSSGRTAE